MKLFLDDYRSPDDCLKYMYKRVGANNLIYNDQDWIVVRNYPEFVELIERTKLEDIELISFDHDLADEHYHKNMQEGKINYSGESFNKDYNKTGYHCAKWLINYCLKNKLPLPQTVVHSMNPVGTENIERLIANSRKFLKRYNTGLI